MDAATDKIISNYFGKLKHPSQSFPKLKKNVGVFLL